MSDDLFAPREAGTKHKFGDLKVFATPVNFKSGASYTLPGVYGREGQPRMFAGKEKVAADATRNIHIVLDLISENKDGVPYHSVRDHLSSDKVYKTTVYPTLALAPGITEKYLPVEVEEVATGETFKGRDDATVERTTFKVIRVFPDAAARKAAEKAYFAKFGGNNADPSTSGGSAVSSPASATNGGNPLAAFAERIRAQYAAEYKGGNGAVQDRILTAVLDDYGTQATTPKHVREILEA